MGKGAYIAMEQVEVRLAQRWRKEFKMGTKEIARLLFRAPKTIRDKLEKLKDKKAMREERVGRPQMPTQARAKCMAALEELQKKAEGQREVTAAMVITKAGVSYCERTVREFFASQGKPFRKLREKPLLTPDDIEKRKVFAKKYSVRSASSWVNSPHAIIDNKTFAMYLDKKGREHVARRSVRGAYRSGASAVEGHLVKPKKTLKYPAQGVMVTAAVIAGRIRMMHVVNGRWNAAQASNMYEGPLVKALEKAFPEHAAKAGAKWLVLEDNDPSGYKAKSVEAKKAELGIHVLQLPPRSPDLNVLDYSLWHEINVRLRKQESVFPASKKEPKQQFVDRLRRT